jgi:hypothetical protein
MDWNITSSMRTGNLAGFGNTGVTALCDFLEDTTYIRGFLPYVHEGGYVKSDISFITLMHIAGKGKESNTCDFSLSDLLYSLIGETGNKTSHYERRGFGEQGHLANRAHMLKYIPREKILPIVKYSLQGLGILDNDKCQLPLETIDESDVISAFQIFTSRIIDELISEEGPYSTKAVTSLFFKNDPPAAYPDISCKLHDYSIFICRPPSDTTYDLLRHYKMDMTDSNIDWHISSYRATMKSFLARAKNIPEELLFAKARMIEFPAFVKSSQARSDLASFIVQDTTNLDYLISQSERQTPRKFDPNKSRTNIGHGDNLPTEMKKRVKAELDPLYLDLVEYCAKTSILIRE